MPAVSHRNETHLCLSHRQVNTLTSKENSRSRRSGEAREVPSGRIAIIIPACNEEVCIGPVLEELLGAIDPTKYVVAVGVNNSTDRTAEIAREYPVLVTETVGAGIRISAVRRRSMNSWPSIRQSGHTYFLPDDGASDPCDLGRITAAYEQGYALVLGARTTSWRNWRAMTLPHVLANVSLGGWCGLLSGRWFRDLAPLRLIDRALFEALAPQEMTFGWTIETQVGAAMHGANICEIPARERARLAGEQKVSGVTWRRTFLIGCRILAAGWRARRRFLRVRAMDSPGAAGGTHRAVANRRISDDEVSFR